MRIRYLIPLALLPVLTGADAGAQARLDRRALDELAPPSARSPAVTPVPAPVPFAPPPPPVVPPPIAVPARPPLPAPPVSVAADAPGTASPIEGGWRITFGADRAELNPATAQALRDLARQLPPGASVIVTAFAAGTPQDPSTARRLSLARALAARAVLIADGIASPRIIVRSMGASQPAMSAGPPDRVDLTIQVATSPVPAPLMQQAKPVP